MLDDIDVKLRKSVDIINQNASSISSSNEFTKINQLKQDIIHQSIQFGRTMVESLIKIVHDEQKRFFFKKNAK